MSVRKNVKNILKSSLCILIVITYVTNCMMLPVFANDENKVYQLYEENDNVCIYSNNVNIQGSKKCIFSKIEELTSNIDILDGIITNMDTETNFKSNYVVSQNTYDDTTDIYSESTVGIYVSEVENSNIILAEDTISVSASNVNWKNGILASKNGNININVSDINYSGIVYAPNGKVSITGSNVTIDGMIIADSVEMYAGTVAITNSTMEVYNALSYPKLSDSTRFIMFYSDENEKIGIEYEYDYASIDLYYRYDEGDFICKKDFDVNSYLELPDKNGYLEGYIVVTDKFGEKTVSNIVSFYKDEYCYEATRDTDCDGISDAYEIRDLKTNPNKKDSDGDGIIDCYDIYDTDKYYDVEIRMNKETYEYITAELGQMYVINEEKTTDNEVVCCLKKSLFDNEVRYFAEDGMESLIVYDSVSGDVKLKADKNGFMEYVGDNTGKKYAVLANDGINDIVNVYKYDDSGNLIEIIHNGFSYNLTYDNNGVKEVNIADNPYIDYAYNNSGNISSTTYGNGYKYSYEYDELGNILKISSDEGVLYEWKYGEYYMLSGYIDYVNDYTISYSYDSDGEISEITYNNGDYIKYSYDEVNFKKIIGVSNKEFVFDYFIGETSSMSQFDNGLKKATYFGDEEENKESYLYNGNSVVNINEFYEDGKYVKCVGEDKYEYEFDENGNIVSEYINGSLLNSYEYDYLGQVIRANIKDMNKTVLYEYDAGGNIKCVRICELSYDNEPKVLQEISYSYDTNWKDLLTVYDGQSIMYDEIGNPIKYTCDRELVWNEGRNLSSIISNENRYDYSYNSDGVRVSKNINGEKVEFLYEGRNLIYEKNNTYDIMFLYDENSELVGFEYEDNAYIYNKNIQNDVIGIFDMNGEEVVKYTYDLWGKEISISGDETLGRINPFRFKSYYFDEESGLYYLNSRYYDPSTGRFINADKHIDTNVGIFSSNMFAYCNNSPIVQANYSGEVPAIILVGVIGGIAMFATACSSNYEPQYNTYYNWKENMKNYNCYGFAINKLTIGKTDPGYLVKNDKDQDGNSIYKENENGGIWNLKNLQSNAIADLKKIGYKQVKTLVRSDISKATGTVICLRVGDGGYHWMKYIKDKDYWLHKPGETAVLKLKGEPQSYKIWYSEYYYEECWYISERTYTSQILYISYK